MTRSEFRKTKLCVLLAFCFATSETASFRKKPKNPQIGFQGVGFGGGNPRPGTEEGPSYVRSGGFLKYLEVNAGIDVKDFGDMTFKVSEPVRTTFPVGNKTSIGILNVHEVSAATKKISEQTEKIAKEGRVVLSAGGDHSIVIGTIDGMSKVHPNLAILYVDAHADINTIGTTPSGNLHGMPLSIVVKELEKWNVPMMKDFCWVTAQIPATNVAHIGLRSVDPGETVIIDTLKTHSYGMREIDHHGILEVTRKALEDISPGGSRPVHVSFDLDVLDDLEIEGHAGTPEPGGLTLRDGMTLLQFVQESVNIVSIDFVEINMELGKSGYNPQRLAILSKYLAGCAFGYCNGGLSKYSEFHDYMINLQQFQLAWPIWPYHWITSYDRSSKETHKQENAVLHFGRVNHRKMTC